MNYLILRARDITFLKTILKFQMSYTEQTKPRKFLVHTAPRVRPSISEIMLDFNVYSNLQVHLRTQTFV